MGKKCHKCGKQTMYPDKVNKMILRCSQPECNATINIPSQSPGKGNQCSICKKFTVKNGKCESCLSRYN